MGTKVNYTVVGLFVILLTAALVTLFVWLSAFKTDVQYKTYLLYTQDDVAGLVKQSTVYFNGVNVGFVKSIELDKRNPQIVIVQLQIEESVPITTGTVATLTAQGITGVVTVNLKVDQIDKPLLKAAPGIPYPIIPSRPSLLGQLSTALPKIAKNIEMFSGRVHELLDEENLQSFKDAMKNLKVFTKTLSDNSANLTASMKSLNAVLAKTKTATENLPEVMSDFDWTLRSIRQAMKDFSDASLSADRAFKSGTTAIDSISSQVLPATQQLLSSLNTSAIHLQEVTSNLERNPSMLLRGKQAALPGPGE